MPFLVRRWTLAGREAHEVSPSCWTKGMLTEDGKLLRRDTQALPCGVRHCLQMTSLGEFSPVTYMPYWAKMCKIGAADCAWQPWGKQGWPAAGPTIVELQQAGQVVWVSSRSSQPAGEMSPNRCAEDCASALTPHSESELFISLGCGGNPF